MSCPSDNASADPNDCFFCPGGINWDTHRIGWAIAGGCAALTTLITLFTLTMHATHYQQPAAQRQVMRVLLMPPVYAIVSFFSYRYYREYEYYVLAETAYEAITLSAFLMLLMELVALSTADMNIYSVLKEKDKKKLPFPFGFWRFRASKPYFMHTLSFSVMQYVIIRPLISIIGIICEYYEVLCPQKYSVHFAEVYLEAVDFVSISFALYGLIVFYVLCKDELKGRRPLNKFLAIKLIVFFTFYQSFVFSVLQNYDVIKATDYWTADNVADGLSALCTTVEMVVFSVYMGWAYQWTEYTSSERNPYQRPTGIKTYFQAIWDTINLSDFATEIWLALKFFTNYLRGVPGTSSKPTKMQQTFMPHTINPQEKLPMSSMDTSRPSVSTDYPQRSATATYEREHGADHGDTTDSPHHASLPAGSPQTTPQAYPRGLAQRTGYEHGSPHTPVAFPSPHPTGYPSALQPGMASPVQHGPPIPLRSSQPPYGTDMEEGASRWPEPPRQTAHWTQYAQQNQRPDSGIGIPGNPKLY